MALYRFYLLNGDGHLHRRRDMDCPTDGAAKESGRAYLLSFDRYFEGVEVWQGGRFVAKLALQEGAAFTRRESAK